MRMKLSLMTIPVVAGLAATILGGFKGGGDAIKLALPPIVVGIGVVAGVP